ncbi:uncharacterized protein LOC113342207 [Papaver somniferum]|uniref:uncharacterized protein LOC113342207 n=1 Tax=Papaver somniferum TaxID=3469 RepID=UPI000E6FF0B4|nr:uncharacterized protein LOC113342207 [Papaver somniferum]
MLDVVPSMEEIKAAVFDLGADSAPGTDGFSGCFYRHYWDLIHQDLSKAIIFCWNNKTIPHGVNSSLILLLAKVRVADSLRKYRPIGLRNFFFKIFTKILATRLGKVLDSLVSEEQVAFMKGRNIHENISLASEMGNMKNLTNLVKLLDDHQRASGQRVCREKSKIYYGGGSLNRRQTIVDFLGIEVTFLSNRYLGVKVMHGAVKYKHISNVVDKLKDQLSVLKGKMLSFQDRVVLVKTVLSSCAIHNMAVYKWPVKFIQQCERVIRNFLWSGDSNLFRAFVVGYDKIYSSVKEGGVGITRLRTMNKVLIMKLWWSIKSSKKKWARFLE